MFRSKLVKSCAVAVRACAKPAMTVRTLSFVTPVSSIRFSNASKQFMPYTVQQRHFSSEMLSGKDICAKIDACGINDAGKEAVVNEEVKKKNFAGLRDAAETLILDDKTKELGILCFVQAADAGDMLSQFAVGNLYLQRYWQEKMKPDVDARKRDDLMDKAKSWYEKASNQGHVPSKVGFAKMCLEDPTSDNVTTAMKIYEEADKADNVDATYNLGFIYYEGLYNVPKDRVRGFNYLKRAADLGDISACYFLGFSYHKGLFENDNPNAQVPTTSKPGEGGAQLCEKDIEKCLAYLEKAAKGGHSKAHIYLHQMYHTGDGVEKDLTKSHDHLLQAMRQGDPEALFIRGNQLYTGEDGIEKDLKKALQLFLDAGARGNADAMCSAGAMIYNGEGQEKDLKKAFEVYTNAASLGSLAAIKNIASMYLLGEGVEKDVETAKNLMKFIEEEEKKKKMEESIVLKKHNISNATNSSLAQLFHLEIRHKNTYIHIKI